MPKNHTLKLKPANIRNSLNIVWKFDEKILRENKTEKKSD